ncbi:MAG: cysteine ABC transporter permease, partial [Anaerorhabdus sp.]
DTSLASNITILEMLMATQRIIARTYEPFALYCEVGLIYLIICTILSKIQHVLENRFKLEY